MFNENEKLAQELEVKQREYLKLLQETRDNVDLFSMVSEGGKVGETEGYKAMKERIHLLTEENHILFEQVNYYIIHSGQTLHLAVDIVYYPVLVLLFSYDNLYHLSS
jgi:hypothetical protein